MTVEIDGRSYQILSTHDAAELPNLRALWNDSGVIAEHVVKLDSPRARVPKLATEWSGGLWTIDQSLPVATVPAVAFAA